MTGSRLLLMLLCLGCVQIRGLNKFKSLKCYHSKDYLELSECRIRAFNRTQNVINVKANLVKTISQLRIDFKLLKRERGGWHPFMYAMSTDICDYFRHPKKYVVQSLIYYYVRNYTNVDHTCPYQANSTIHLMGWKLDESSIIARFPIDPGEYALHTSWYMGKVLFLQVNGSVAYNQY